jgi:hypothetical protein
MKASVSTVLVVALVAVGAPPASAQGVSVESGNGLRLDLDAIVDLEAYDTGEPPPGLVFGEGDAFFNPRLSVFSGVRFGQRVLGFVQVRADRGFDPLADSPDFRADEYYVRVVASTGGHLNLQAGKSATLVGNWVARHYSWDNPFVTAPLPYENVTIVWDRWQPDSTAAFLGYLNQADRKADMLPMIWGPVYATGISALGSAGRWDYGVEVKNAGLSSRPIDWDWSNAGLSRPTVGGRVALRPNAAWNVGLSASRGVYMVEDPSRTLEGGAKLDDFHQTTIGPEVSYSKGHLQLWGELFWSRFRVQHVGDVSTTSYYAEAKYKLTPQLFGAVRWGQQFFSDVDGAPWDGPASRLEFALGYRLSRRVQGKAQYGITTEDRPVTQGRHLTAIQLTIRL